MKVQELLLELYKMKYELNRNKEQIEKKVFNKRMGQINATIKMIMEITNGQV